MRDNQRSYTWEGASDPVENTGFQRLAVTLRGLAKGYDREAERIVNEHRREDED